MIRSAARIAIAVGCYCLAGINQAAPPAKEADPVALAIQKGVRYLKEVHKPGANYIGGSHGVGTATLAGLALLECGAEPTDPVVAQIAKFVRAEAYGESKTYELSLCIMFLDRLGSKSDQSLIQVLGARLLLGQQPDGAWSYDCVAPPEPAEERRLKAALVAESQLVGVKGKPKESPIKENPAEDDPKKPSGGQLKNTLHPEAAKILKLQNNHKEGKGERQRPDHSNTQFATMGLWVAHRHGVPVGTAFENLEKHYRDCQSPDGGWGYTTRFSFSTPSMTCAGLMGLAMRPGMNAELNLNPEKDNVKPDPVKDLTKDPAIQKGLSALADFLANDGGPEMPKRGKGKREDHELGQNLYFMWSLERVGMIYGIDKIGDRNWYDWGSRILIQEQNANGSWAVGRGIGAGADIETPMALLFLKRANLARDLTSLLTGKPPEMGNAVLKSGDPAKVLPGIKPQPPVEVGPNPRDALAAKPAPIPKPMPISEIANEFEKLGNEFLIAAPAHKEAALAKLRDTKGSVYTAALAHAIAKSEGEDLAQARTALAERLARMTPATLRDMLKDPNREIRRGAALACAMKDDKQYVPDLIPLLADSESLVGRAAKAALKALSGQDFGPTPDASDAERKKAIQLWKEWWETRK